MEVLALRRFSLVLFVACVAMGATQASSGPSVGIYFGCGCFWHVQHELIQAERSVLSRSDAELTALAGYAAGTETNGIGRACYPYYNRALGDHTLLHAEVVGMEIPVASVRAMSAEYWRLFVGINRVDVQDVGPEYRAVIGLPGGMTSTLLAEIDAAQSGVVQQNFELREGTGGDADTLGQALVWVYDSNVFPFYQGEVYHQFHDDIVERYPKTYNDLNALFVSDCRLAPTGCHNDPIREVDGCPHQPPVVNTNNASADYMIEVDLGGGGSGGGSGSFAADGLGSSADISTDNGIAVAASGTRRVLALMLASWSVGLFVLLMHG